MIVRKFKTAIIIILAFVTVLPYLQSPFYALEQVLPFAKATASKGLSFESKGDGTCCVYSIGECTDTEIIIPQKSPEGDTVTSIRRYAFSEEKSIKKVVIPNTVTLIDPFAFSYCTELQEITIPDSVAVIEGYAFTGCVKLKEVSLPGKLLSVEEGTFYNCTNLSKVVFSNNIKIINSRAFSNCDKIAKLSLPDSINEIDESAFSYCDALEEVKLPNNLRTIPKNCFAGCSSLKKIIMPNVLETIGEMAFYACTSITEFTVPSGVKKIDSNAFYGCSSLVSFTIPISVASLDSTIISNCNSLYTVYYEGSNIDWENNFGVFKLNNVTMQYKEYIEILNYSVGLEYFSHGDGTCSVIGIGSCKDKKIIVPEVNPSGERVTMVGDFAFSLCEVRYGLHYHTESELSSVILPSSVTFIGEYAFCGCSGFREFSIPKNVTAIEPHAFDGCSKIKEFIIPQGATEIEHWLFSNCASLEKVTIPSSVTAIREGAFYKCDSLENVYFEGSKEDWAKIYIHDSNINVLAAATVHFTNGESGTVGKDDEDLPNLPIIDFKLYSDNPGLCIRKDGIITIGGGYFYDDIPHLNNSDISIQIEDSSVLNIVAIKEQDGLKYAEIKALKEGTTKVIFTSPVISPAKEVLVTVFDDNYLSYTLDTVPVKYIDKYPTNIYNANGLFVDSYKYELALDGSAQITFDVYNALYIYGAVEVYTASGDLYEVTLIDKMTSNDTSIKEVLWDSVGCLVRDFLDGDIGSYRQENNFSKKTSVSITVPKDGYIKITNDPKASLIVSVVNSVDLLLTIRSLAGDIENLDAKKDIFMKDFSKELKTNKEFLGSLKKLKESAKIENVFMKSTAQKVFFSLDDLSSFASSLSAELQLLGIGKIILSAAVDAGLDVGSDFLKYFMGPWSETLDTMFFMAKVMALATEYVHIQESYGTGYSLIQNQGGGIRAAEQITVKSDSDFDKDVALAVFSTELTLEGVEQLKLLNPEIYNKLQNGKHYTYNISLMKNSEETQPGGKVKVYIPVPNELVNYVENGWVGVYRTESDGSMTDMNAIVENGHFVFETEHFSLYTVLGCDLPNDSGAADNGTNDNNLGFTENSNTVINTKANSDNSIVIIAVVVVLTVACGVIIAVLLIAKGKSSKLDKNKQ